MVKIYQQPFAHAGAKQVIPDASDPQGFVSNADGFTTDYELPDTDPNYKPIERAEFNGLMNMITESLGEIQQFGFAKWQPMTWPQGARVVEGGVVYRALVQTAQQPPHADWADDSAIGVGQTWQDMTGSRAIATTYTNTTGRSIQVSVSAVSETQADLYLQLHVGSIAVATNQIDLDLDNTRRANVSATVPPGETYLLEGVYQLGLSWRELR